jgi:hypothetical protein
MDLNFFVNLNEQRHERSKTVFQNLPDICTPPPQQCNETSDTGLRPISTHARDYSTMQIPKHWSASI